MKTVFALAIGILAAFAPDAAAQGNRGRDRDRVCFYQDIRYQGWEECYYPGDELPDLRRHNNAISSIRIFGRARITVYDDRNFEGRSADFRSDVPDLGLRNLAGSRSWSDRIESFRIDSGNSATARGRFGGFGPPDFEESRQDPSNGICVYERADYQGRSECWNSGYQIRDLGRQGDLSDKISSIRVFGRNVVVVYRDIDFQGESIVIDRDTPDLNAIGARTFGNWNDQISSLEIEAERGRPRGRR